MHRKLAIRWKRGALSAALVLGLTGPAYAVDGVIEINQVLAKAGGVTPGDTPLFPVTISQAGSYRLTSNLDVTDASARSPGAAAENTTAIEVKADNVTIDLNGFMIKGPTTCSGIPATCSPIGTGNGVDASTVNFNTSGVAVANGTVQGMGNTGIQLLNASQVERVRAVGNGGFGITAGTVTNCTAHRNGGNGIHAVTVAGCTASENGGTGIVGSNGVVANCTANFNGGNGIFASTAVGCTANNNNIGVGATTASSCTARDNREFDIGAAGIKGQNSCGYPPSPCP